MSFLPSRRIQLLALTLGTAVLVGGVPLAAGASSADTTASVLKAAKASMVKQSGVHVVVTSKAGKTSSKVVVDIGLNSGIETITSGDKQVTIIVTPTYAYLSGSKTGLINIMGLTAAQQKKLGSKFLTMKSGTSPYSNLKSNLTTPVFATMLPAAPGTSLTTTTSSNKKVFNLSWVTKATTSSVQTSSVMSFSSGKSTLPFKEVITSKTGSGLTLFTKWGEKVSEKAPAASMQIAYKKVFG